MLDWKNIHKGRRQNPARIRRKEYDSVQPFSFQHVLDLERVLHSIRALGLMPVREKGGLRGSFTNAGLLGGSKSDFTLELDVFGGQEGTVRFRRM